MAYTEKKRSKKRGKRWEKKSELIFPVLDRENEFLTYPMSHRRLIFSHSDALSLFSGKGVREGHEGVRENSETRFLV